MSKEKVEEKKGTCAECKWYDKSREKLMHRDKVRKGLTEVRAPCMNASIPAYRHRVHSLSQRPCFEYGVYVAQKVEEKKLVKEIKPVAPEPAKPEAKKKRKKITVVENPLNGKK
jgi:hypothetical protein